MALTADQKDNFFKHHLPHRLCLLTTFRDRQAWFAKRIGKKDKDLLRASKDSSLIMIRMFAEFLGLKEGRRKKNGGPKSGSPDDDVFLEMLGCPRVSLASLPQSEQDVITALTRRGNKELAHLTSSFADQLKFNTAEYIVEGIEIIARLLREKVYDQAQDRKGRKYPFPDLESEKTIDGNEYEIVGGRPCKWPDWQ
jgi:hypothetical protein